jgi:hypothetical protein
MKSGPVGAILLFTFASLNHALSAEQHNSPHFRVNSPDYTLSEKVAAILEEAYQKGEEYFNSGLADTVRVFVTETTEKFDQLVAGTLPDWSIACAIPDVNTIILKSPDEFHYRKDMREVLWHELAHVFLWHFVKGKDTPTWANEGFSVWFSEKWGWEERIRVARAVLTSSLIRLSEIDSLHFFRESKASLAYAESFLAVSYFESLYGTSALRDVLSDFAATGDFYLSFEQVTGLDFNSFEKEFEQMARQNYNWVAILSDSLLLWTGLAMLFVLLYFIKRRRSKRIIERWEREDRGLAPKDFDT